MILKVGYVLIGPPYDPIIYRIIPLTLYYALLFILGFHLSFKLFQKSRRIKSKEAKLLGISYFFYSIANLIAFIGLLEVIITLEFREIYRISLPLGYSMGVFGNIFLLMFCYNLLKFNKMIKYLYLTLYGIVLILINLYINWYGVPHWFYEGNFSIRQISSLSLLLVSASLYIFLICKFSKINYSDNLVNFGYKLIKYSLICFTLFWFCMLMDAIYILVCGIGFSFFVFIAWTFALLFWILSYAGYMMPKKIRKYYERTHKT